MARKKMFGKIPGSAAAKKIAARKMKKIPGKFQPVFPAGGGGGPTGFVSPGAGTTLGFNPVPALTPSFPVQSGFDPLGFDPGVAVGLCDGISNPVLRALCEAGGSLLPGQRGPGTAGREQGIVTPCPPSIPGCPGFDPTPGFQTPGERSLLPAGAPGLQAPFAMQRTVLQCPPMGTRGAQGILWKNEMAGVIVCLPRGVSGKQFGLVRKNEPPTKPLFTGGDVNCLRRAERLQKKFRKIDKLFGATAKKRGR